MLTLRQIRWKLAKSDLRVPVVWYRHRGLRDDDVFIAGYPRSGTTWLRFMLYEILSGMDTEFESVNEAIPEVGQKHTGMPLLRGGGRLLKTHELYRPDYRRAVYIARDVRDVAVSEYFYLTMKRYIPAQEFDRFLAEFLRHRVNTFGSWIAHVDSWLEAMERQQVELLVVKYEQLLEQKQAELERIVSFLGLEVDRGRIRAAIEHNSKEGMRRKEDHARKTIFKSFRDDIRFVRKAQAGGWRETITEPQLAAIESRARQPLSQLGYPLYTA
jgi:hypothetical protein